MTNLSLTKFAVAGFLVFGSAIVPALADGGSGPSFQLAEMMGMKPSPAPAAGTGMAPAQSGGAPDAAGMKGGMKDDGMSMGMGMQPMLPAPPQGAPGGGMKAGMGDDKMAMPGGCCMQKMQSPGGMAATPGGMAGTAAQPMPMPQQPQPQPQPQPSAPLDHMEGRIAFLRAELGITLEQSQAWEQFAQALRTGREHQGAAGQALATSSGVQYGAPDRLEAHERHLALRLESLRTARESFQRLYLSMNAAQRQNADQLVLPILVSF